MSWCTSDSDSCGNDFDDDVVPSAGMPSPKNFSFTWKQNWRKVDVILVSGTGHRETVVDEAGCFQPVKFQFILDTKGMKMDFITKHLPSMAIKGIEAGPEILEITLKSDIHPGMSTEISALLSNEMENVFMRTVPLLPHTSKFLEELFETELRTDKLAMVRDTSKVYIAGPTPMRDYICKTLKRMNELTSRVVVELDEEWKKAAVKKFNCISMLERRFPNVSIKSETDNKSITLVGSETDVQTTEEQLSILISTYSTTIQRIPVDRLILELMRKKPASDRFEEIVNKMGVNVAWIQEDNCLCLIGEKPFPKRDIEIALSSVFVCVGFYQCDKLSFCISEVFTNAVEKFDQNLLVIERSGHGCIVAATKNVIKEILEMEQTYDKTSSTGLQVPAQVLKNEPLTKNTELKTARIMRKKNQFFLRNR